MNGLKKYIILLLGIVWCQSCSNTIDFTPTDSYNELAVWQDEKSVNLYVNSFYRIFTDYNQYGNRPIGNDFTMADGLSDIMKYTSNSPGEGTGNLIMTQDGYTSVAANHFNVWGSAYVWNRRMLEFLEDLKKYSSKFPKEKVDRLEAEVRFFRGYMFFLVMRNHGSFIIKKTLADPIQMPLNSVNECWDFVEQDLDFAAQFLPSSWPTAEEGRVSKWAALAMKSRAMLYAKRWQKAADAAETVVTQGPFILEANYADVFKNRKTDRSKEHILVKRYSSALGVIHNIDERIAPSGDIQGRGGVVVPTQELVDAYLMSDGKSFTSSKFDSTMYTNRESRFYASILYNGAPWKGRKIETWVGETNQQGNGKDRFIPYNSTPYPFSTVTGYYIRKLADEANTDFDQAYRKSDQDCIEIRLAEVHLNLAEANLELNKIADAKKHILAVRNRSLQTDVTDIAGDLRSELIRERMLELAFEGHRFWDLRRWGLANEMFSNKKLTGAKITKKSNGVLSYERVDVDVNPRIYPKKFNQFPLPIGELNNNPLITQQPEGW